MGVTKHGTVTETVPSMMRPAPIGARTFVTVARPLDKRAFTAYTLHCSECGRVYEADTVPAWWSDEMIAKLDWYFGDEGGDDDWHSDMAMTDPDMDGRALVCPSCWEVSWCEECNSAIHVWQEFEREPLDSREAHWHATCCTEEHEHQVLPASSLRDERVEVKS